MLLCMTMTGFAQEAVTPPADLATQDYTLGGYMMYYENDTQKQEAINKTVQVGFSGNDVYINGLSYYMGDAGWIKGTLNADKTAVTIATPQYWGAYMGQYPIYFQAMLFDGTSTSFPATVEWGYDATTGNFSIPETFYYYEVDGITENASWYNLFGYMSLVKGTAPEPELVQLPEDITPVEYQFSAYDNYNQENVSRNILVGIKDNDIYVNGVCSILPDAWIKGTLSEGQATFAANQYLGKIQDYVFYFSPDADVVFTTTDKGNTITAEAYTVTFNGNPYDEYTNILVKRVVEQAGTPANPNIVAVGKDRSGYDRIAFDIPLTDTDGNAMVTSKLFYQMFIDINGTVSEMVFKKDNYQSLSEDMTVIPYVLQDDWDFFPNSVYLYDDYSQWSKVGMQTIYAGGGEIRKSDIVWFDMSSTGINTVKADRGASMVYDLQGRRVAQPTKGLYIVNGRKVVMK